MDGTCRLVDEDRCCNVKTKLRPGKIICHSTYRVKNANERPQSLISVGPKNCMASISKYVLSVSLLSARKIHPLALPLPSVPEIGHRYVLLKDKTIPRRKPRRIRPSPRAFILIRSEKATQNEKKIANFHRLFPLVPSTRASCVASEQNSCVQTTDLFARLWHAAFNFGGQLKYQILTNFNLYSVDQFTTNNVRSSVCFGSRTLSTLARYYYTQFHEKTHNHTKARFSPIFLLLLYSWQSSPTTRKKMATWSFKLLNTKKKPFFLLSPFNFYLKLYFWISDDTPPSIRPKCLFSLLVYYVIYIYLLCFV